MKSLFFAIALLNLPLFAVETLEINPSNSTAEFSATGRPGGFKINGKAAGDQFSGKLALSGNQATGTVSLKMASFDTGIELRNNHLKDNYLEAGKFPVSSFELKSTQLDDKGNGKFKGLLDLHGQKKEIEGELLLQRSGKSAKLEFSFPVELSDFQIPIPSFAGVKVDSRVEVKVVLDGTLTTQQG